MCLIKMIVKPMEILVFVDAFDQNECKTNGNTCFWSQGVVKQMEILVLGNFLSGFY